jgi:hypothetical protein
MVCVFARAAAVVEGSSGVVGVGALRVVDARARRARVNILWRVGGVCGLV